MSEEEKEYKRIDSFNLIAFCVALTEAGGEGWRVSENVDYAPQNIMAGVFNITLERDPPKRGVGRPKKEVA